MGIFPVVAGFFPILSFVPTLARYRAPLGVGACPPAREQIDKNRISSR